MKNILLQLTLLFSLSPFMIWSQCGNTSVSYTVNQEEVTAYFSSDNTIDSIAITINGNGGYFVTDDSVFTFSFPMTGYNSFCAEVYVDSASTNSFCGIFCESFNTQYAQSCPGDLELVFTDTLNMESIIASVSTQTSIDSTVFYIDSMIYSTTDTSVFHQFPTTGFYTICADVYYNNGNDVCLVCDTANIGVPMPDCPQDIVFDVNTSQSPTITASYTTSTPVDYTTFHFGQLQNFTSNNNSYTHTFISPGTYDVKQIVFYNDTNNYCLHNEQVTISSTSNCPGDLEINFDTTNAPFITANISTSVSVDSVYIDFGEFNSSYYTTDTSITHEYPAYNNTYSVTATIIYSNGLYTCNVSDSVSVSGMPQQGCHYNFDISADTTQTPVEYTVHFDGAAVDSTIISYGFGYAPGGMTTDTMYNNDSISYYNINDTGYHLYQAYIYYEYQNQPYWCFVKDSVYIAPPCGVNANFYWYADSLQANTIQVINNSTVSQSAFWDFGDGNTSTNPYPTHSYPTNGPYNVCLTVTDSSGCSDIFCDSIYDVTKTPGMVVNVTPPSNGTSSIAEVEKKQDILVYPNPGSNYLTINAEKTEQIENINLYSISGQMVHSININSLQNIDVSFLENGLYLIVFELNNQQTITKKWMKQ